MKSLREETDHRKSKIIPYIATYQLANNVPPSRREIAKAVGLTMGVVCRTLKQMKDDGTIYYSRRARSLQLIEQNDLSLLPRQNNQRVHCRAHVRF